MRHTPFYSGRSVSGCAPAFYCYRPQLLDSEHHDVATADVIMQTATKNPAIPRTPRCSAKNAVSCRHISATKASAGRTCSETRTATVAQAHATGDPLSQKRIAVWSPLLHHELLRKSSAPALKTPSRLVSAKAATMVGIPVNFELVMAVAVGSFFVHHFYMGFAVGAARKKCATCSPCVINVGMHPVFYRSRLHRSDLTGLCGRLLTHTRRLL